MQDKPPKKKLLKLNTQNGSVLSNHGVVLGQLTANQIDSLRTDVNTEPEAIPDEPQLPENSNNSNRPMQPKVPMPSVSTMLDQNPAINEKIAKVMLAKKTPVRPASTTSADSNIMLSPLYSLDNGDRIMVRTQSIQGSDKKVHHLYLYTPPKTGVPATLDAIKIGVTPQVTPIPPPKSRSNISDPQVSSASNSSSNSQISTSQIPNDNNKQVTHCTSQVPLTDDTSSQMSVTDDTSNQVPVNYDNSNQLLVADETIYKLTEAERNRVYPDSLASPTEAMDLSLNTQRFDTDPSLTRLVTPGRVASRPESKSFHPHYGDVENSESAASRSYSVVTAIPKVPTKQLVWKSVVDEFGTVTEEKTLTYADL